MKSIALAMYIIVQSGTLAHAMGGTQFGTYSQAYLDRQKCKADPKCKPFCYKGGRLCDCKTHVCEGENR